MWTRFRRWCARFVRNCSTHISPQTPRRRRASWRRGASFRSHSPRTVTTFIANRRRIFASARWRRVAFRCAMIGDGPLHGELKAKRAELGLDNVVAMPGAAEQGEVLQWWRRAAVGVLTSEHEGMPVSLMEAAACGVPVVATRVGGVPELVRDGETGLLAPAGDAAAVGGAVAKMLGDASWRARVGAAARRRGGEEFFRRHQRGQFLALWAGVVAGRPPGRRAIFGTSGGGNRQQIAAPPGAPPP